MARSEETLFDEASIENSADSNTGAIIPPNYVVGIAASVGGLESLEKLFHNLPADTRMAFVV